MIIFGPDAAVLRGFRACKQAYFRRYTVNELVVECRLRLLLVQGLRQQTLELRGYSVLLVIDFGAQSDARVRLEQLLQLATPVVLSSHYLNLHLELLLIVAS